MSDVIQKYLKLGVLNYIDHETPRHYFLWDGIMEEEPGKVHSVVEELCDENIKLRKALEIYERERNRYKHAYPEKTGAYFLAGGHGDVDTNLLPEYVRIVPAYGCAWEQIYEKTDKTIMYEGS